MTTTQDNTRRDGVRSIACSAFFTNLRTHWQNWWNRGTAKAYRNLTQAMKNDPMYAHSWQCNIAMPIYDGARGKLTIKEANQIADDLMKHLFDVPNAASDRMAGNPAGRSE